MLKNYLRTFWKVARQNKLFTFLSLFGISLTIMFVMIFSMTVNKVVKGSGPEKHLGNILVAENMKVRTQKRGGNEVFSGIGRTECEEYFKKIASADKISMFYGYEWEFRQNGRQYKKGFMVTDAEFWEMFDFDFIQGRPYTREEVTNGANLAVITESLKEVLFGNDNNVLGKTVKYMDYSLTILGVVKDVPPTSQNLQSGLFYPYTIWPAEKPDPRSFSPYSGAFSLAFKAKDRKQFAAIRRDFQAIIQRIDAADPNLALFVAGPNTQWERLFATFDPEDDFGPWALLRKYFLWGFGFIFLPAVNLMALNFARIRERGEEIAVRKSFGASSAVLKGQFIFENLVLTIAGGVMGILLSFLVVALLGNTLTIPVKAGTTVPMSFSFDFLVFGIALGVCLLFGMLSGVLPAIRMSRMKPVKYLKGGEI
jgi:putative ABC transport system permease protein